MIQKYKVAAYITQADWLLVFSEPAYPAAGIQIPGGSIEPGEDPDRAMLREAVRSISSFGFLKSTNPSTRLAQVV